MRFYLGTHVTSWLEFIDIPLFISHRRLSKCRRLPRALGSWALDSGGFSELSLFGRWKTTAHVYAAEVRRYTAEVGGLEWAAPQDWMCEPQILAKTGFSIENHQWRTIESVMHLRSLLDEHVIPVLQGWKLGDYLQHVEMYERSGIDLREEAVVGVGSVCRRQHTEEATEIFTKLSAQGLQLHGFGVKTQGLRQNAATLVSADSMAWSFDARYAEPLLGCSHKNCANCDRYAMRWRGRLLQSLRGRQIQRVADLAPYESAEVEVEEQRLRGSSRRRRLT